MPGVPRGSDRGRSRRHRAAHRRGYRAERIAGIFLALKGYRVLARRYRTRVGEIDLVVRRGGVLAFIEVKRRAGTASALDAITQRSRARIRRAAELFLLRNPALAGLSLRFDAIVITPWRWPRHVVDAWQD